LSILDNRAEEIGYQKNPSWMVQFLIGIGIVIAIGIDKNSMAAIRFRFR